MSGSRLEGSTPMPTGLINVLDTRLTRTRRGILVAARKRMADGATQFIGLFPIGWEKTTLVWRSGQLKTI